MFNIQNRARQHFCMNYIDNACMHKCFRNSTIYKVFQISVRPNMLYFLNAGVQGYQIRHSLEGHKGHEGQEVHEDICIPLTFSAFFCIFLHFSAFLYIFLHFSALLCIYLHFTFSIQGQFDGAYHGPMDGIFTRYLDCFFDRPRGQKNTTTVGFIFFWASIQSIALILWRSFKPVGSGWV